MIKKQIFSPGPTTVPERVVFAMAGPLFHHRSHAFRELFKEVREGLQYVFQTQSEVLIFASSGTGALEGAVCNTLSPGDKALVVRGGKFGNRWSEICEAYSIAGIPIDVTWGTAVNPAAIERALDRDPSIKAIFVQATETSTGVMHPIQEIADIVRKRKDAILVVDAISALGAVDLPMDAWGLDVVISCSQKAFMLPPGLSFVALSDKAWRSVERSTLPKYYFNFKKELISVQENQTQFTPAISLIVGLRETLRMIQQEGRAKIFRRHEKCAQATREAVKSLGLELFAPTSPSDALTAIKVPRGIDAEKLARDIEDKFGLIIAGGQAHLKGKIIRIAHLGYVQPLDIILAVSALELTLKDMGYPVDLGKGVKVAEGILSSA